MSIYLMSVVWTLDLPRHVVFFLLTLADHASDDGTNIYPSIRYLSWKTGYSERQIQRLLKILLQEGILRILVEATHDFPNHYQMNLEFCKKKLPFDRGDKKSPHIRGDKQFRQVVTNVVGRGDTIPSPKPPIETSLKTPLQQIASNDEEQIHIPDDISGVLKSEIVKKLRGVRIEDRQQLVDELVGRMAISKVKNPIGYLGAMLKKFNVGEFTPELAQQVKSNRDSLRQRELIRAKMEREIQVNLCTDKSSPTDEFKEILAKMKIKKVT